MTWLRSARDGRGARSAEQRQLLGADTAAPLRQAGHDGRALGVAEAAPAAHLGQRAIAAEAEPALAVDDTDFHARRGDRLRVHLVQMPCRSGQDKSVDRTYSVRKQYLQCGR